ncbi:MAG: hypothetical protein ACTH58_04550 [Marinomonas foliarum]|uniref:hypothetical protein n=1 Tax=Marinomonas TaxID=28253 RepID=UPI003F9DC50F
MISSLRVNLNHPLEHAEKKPAKYSWLISGVNEPSWRFKPHIETDELSKYTINWFYDDTLESDSQWVYWVDRAKEQLICRMENFKKRTLTTSSLVGYARSLRAFFKFIFIERRCMFLEDISISDIDAYKQCLLDRDIKRSTTEGLLLPIADLYSMRESLQESLDFDPFIDQSLFTYAKKLSKSNSHTETLLPREIFFVLNKALKLIKNSDKTLQLLDSYMELRDGGKKNDPSKIFAKLFGITASKLIMDVNILYGAALTITFLLTAERKHEAALRDTDDLAKLLNRELDVLYGLEKKTSGSLSGKKTEVAVISEVIDAFRVIMRITEYKRKESGEKKVLLKTPLQHSVKSGNKKSYYLHTASIYHLLKCFTKSIGLEELNLRPHMFRRAYSMLWMWRYEIGDMAELSIMLKHNNLFFTKKYTDDENIWHFMPEVEQAMAFDILNRSFQKKITISGGASNTLERYGRLIQAKSRILDPVVIADFVDSMVKQEELKIISHANGYCLITSKSKGESRCLDDKGELSDAKREEKRCVGCPNFGIDDNRREYWEKRIELHQKVVNHSENKSLVESSEQFIEQAKLYIK